MAHCRGTGKVVEIVGGKHVGNETRRLPKPSGTVSVYGADPRGFLTTVLERVEALKRELGDVVHPRDPEDSALFPGELVQRG
jgi:hypothetical protein